MPGLAKASGASVAAAAQIRYHPASRFAPHERGRLETGPLKAMKTISLDPMDLAALLCSRVCHDIISPVGAIMNGLEVLEDEKESGMRDVAIELIKKSAKGASARLQFCRLAYGAAGSAGAAIDTGDAEAVARGLLATEKLTLEWNGAPQLLPKNLVKLLLNLAQIAANAIPRGGVLTVEISGEGDAASARVTARGANAKIPQGYVDLIAGKSDSGKVDARGVQPYYAGLVARQCGLDVEVASEPDALAFVTRRAAAASAA